MKKIFLMAASALLVMASCSKVNVIYDNDPQEIALFSVAKSATKTPVPAGDATFPTDYDMKVAAYLASGDLTANGNGDYFDGTTFTNETGNLWHGGKYWPVSTSTLNFLAVAVPCSSSVYTGEVTVTFGEKIGNESVNSKFVKKAVVTFENNETTANNYNQFDLMYAAGQGVHNEGGDYDNVSMTFKHALSWINFTVATNVSCSLKVNSIRVSKASYSGTMTLTNVNYASTTRTEVETADYSISWTDVSTEDDVYVPGALSNSTVSIADPVTEVTTAPVAFGNGLLVVPVDYSGKDAECPTITINYTMNQGNGNYTFERTITIPEINWEPNKKYTYALTITLNEIKVNPSVGDWGVHDNNDDETDGNQDIPVDADPEPQQQNPTQGE